MKRYFLLIAIGLSILGSVPILYSMELSVAQLNKKLLEAARAGQRERIVELITAGAEVNTKDEQGATPLHYVAQLGLQEADIYQFLLSKGARPDIPNAAGQTPHDIVQANQSMVKKEEGGPASSAPGYLACMGSYMQGALSYTYTGSQYVLGSLWSGALYLKDTSIVGGRYVLYLGECAIQHYLTSVQLRKRITASDEYSAVSASVRPCTSLNNDESQFIERRMPKIKTALKALLQREVPETDIPKIALCFSGGGYRAMLETLGWLSGAQKIGLLDSTLYATGLSGSTWALNPWVASRLSLNEYKAQLLPKLTKTLKEHVASMTAEDIFEVLVALGKKFVDVQSIGPVDFFGALLAQMLLSGIVKDKQAFSLAALAQVVKDGNYPLIISTATLGGKLPIKYRPSFEFSPFEIGSAEFSRGIFIPTWSFARVFQNGVSQPITPVDVFYYEKAAGAMAVASLQKKLSSTEPQAIEEKKRNVPPYFGRQLSLGYLMGIYGSAFAIGLSDVLLELAQRIVPEGICPKESFSESAQMNLLKNILASFLTKTIDAIKIGSLELKSALPELESIREYVQEENYGAAVFPCITHGMPNQPLQESRFMSLVDGGFDVVEGERLNIAILPLLRKDRDLNVIIICDSSAILQGAPSLRAAEKRARHLGVKFPTIDYTDIHKKHISVFIDEEDLETPIIVYIPGIANPTYSTLDPLTAPHTATLNFTYTSEQAEELMGLTEFTMQNASATLREVLLKAIDRKHQLIEKKAGWWSKIWRK